MLDGPKGEKVGSIKFFCMDCGRDLAEEEIEGKIDIIRLPKLPGYKNSIIARGLRIKPHTYNGVGCPNVIETPKVYRLEIDDGYKFNLSENKNKLNCI